MMLTELILEIHVPKIVELESRLCWIGMSNTTLGVVLIPRDRDELQVRYHYSA